MSASFSVSMRSVFVFGCLVTGFVSLAADWKVNVAADPAPPKAGLQYFTIQVQPDASGKGKLKDAEVSLMAIMPEMPGMHTMKSNGRMQKIKDGEFKSRVTLSMNGVWFLHVVVTAGQNKDDFFYRIETGISGIEGVKEIPAKLTDDPASAGGHPHH